MDLPSTHQSNYQCEPLAGPPGGVEIDPILFTDVIEADQAWVEFFSKFISHYSTVCFTASCPFEFFMPNFTISAEFECVTFES